MPLIIAKKNKKFKHCAVKINDGKKCRTQCGLCAMIQYSIENPNKKPYTTKLKKCK